MAASRGAVARAPVSTVTSEGMPLATHALVNNTWQGNSLGPLSEKPALLLIHHSQKAVSDPLGVCAQQLRSRRLGLVLMLPGMVSTREANP